MTVTINGTTGLAGVDGSAGTPAIQGGDTNTGVFFPAADTVGVATGGTERMRVDSSGNVGIGTSSPYAKLHVRPATDCNLYVSNSGTSTVLTTLNDAQSAYNNMQINGLTLQLLTQNTERMRIDSSGRVAIGTATPNTSAMTTVKAADVNYIQFQLEQSNVTDGYALRCSASDGDLAFLRYASSAYTERMRLTTGGNLTITGATATKASGTTWANPSDQRLKNNIRDYDKGTAELMQVRVREWEYNGKGGTTDGMKGLGVIADEVMTVLPATVENYDAKLNADDEETTAIKQFDATEITWLLVKTVQEQQALITALTARIEALEAK